MDNDKEDLACYLEKNTPTYESLSTENKKEVVDLFKKAGKINLYTNFLSIPTAILGFIQYEAPPSGWFYYSVGLGIFGLSMTATNIWKGISSFKRARDLENMCFKIESLERKIFEEEQQTRKDGSKEASEFRTTC